MHTCHSPRPNSSPEFHAVSCQMSVIKILQLCINTFFSVSGRLEHRRVVCVWSVVLPWMAMCADWSLHRRDLERQRNVLDVENWSGRNRKFVSVGTISSNQTQKRSSAGDRTWVFRLPVGRSDHRATLLCSFVWSSCQFTSLLEKKRKEFDLTVW